MMDLSNGIHSQRTEQFVNDSLMNKYTGKRIHIERASHWRV